MYRDIKYRGVKFRTTHSISKLLYCTLYNIEIINYQWLNILEETEVYSQSRKDFALDKRYYSGKDLHDAIRKDSYIIFLKLQAYDNSVTSDKMFRIISYEDFLRSNCKILILVYDCNFVEIYLKDQTIIELLYNNALANNFADVEYITEFNDLRTSMCLR